MPSNPSTVNYSETLDHNYGALETDKQGLITFNTISKWVEETRFQPTWRQDADIESDMYDGKQLDSETLSRMEDLGIPPLIRNLVKPTIKAVLGIEAMNRTDIKIRPDQDDDEEYAEALNVKHHEAARLCKADDGISSSYADQVKVGLGWVETARDNNPWGTKYRVQRIRRQEIWWDWLAERPDLSDARYLIRKRWIDQDMLALYFPKHKELIAMAANEWQDFDSALEESFAHQSLLDAYATHQDHSFDEMQWANPERHRVCPYEIWYRKWQRGTVLRDPATDLVVEADPKNEYHQIAMKSGMVQLEEAVFPKLRLAWFLGPHRLADIPSPYPHNNFPYTPFWGEREDRTLAPYGLLRSMRSPQEEVNARLSKMMWLMSSRTAFVDDDAVENHDEAREELSAPNAYIKLKSDRINRDANAFRIDKQTDLSRQQFEVMQDAAKAIQNTAGVYAQMLGQEVAGGAKSGVAIDSLVQQGMVTLADMNDNYAYARKLVHENLLSLVKQDIGRDPMEVVVGRNTGRQRTVFLNKWQKNPDGGNYLHNNVAHIKTRVELDNIPNTPTYRRQLLVQLTELTKSMPPEMQGLIMDIVVESFDHPRKREMADRIREAMGIEKPLDQMTPEEVEQVKAKMAKQEEIEAMQRTIEALQIQLAKANVDKTEEEAQLTAAKTEEVLAKTAQLEQDTDNEIDTHALAIAEGAQRLSEEPDANKANKN